MKKDFGWKIKSLLEIENFKTYNFFFSFFNEGLELLINCLLTFKKKKVSKIFIIWQEDEHEYKWFKLVYANPKTYLKKDNLKKILNKMSVIIIIIYSNNHKTWITCINIEFKNIFIPSTVVTGVLEETKKTLILWEH